MSPKNDKSLSQNVARKPNNWLLDYAKNYYSQYGEDGILEKIFTIIPDLNLWCVEFGAHDGITNSNTYRLISEYNWFSIQIEMDLERYKLLLERHAENDRVTCLNQLVHFEGQNTLDQILKETSIPQDFDLLCIDVDGNDYHIWESLQNYQPKVVLVEFNPTFPPYLGYVQPKDINVAQGSSLLALQDLGRRKNYELVSSTDTNGIFVRSDYFPLFQISNNATWELNANYIYLTNIFQFYDGSLIMYGNTKLYWRQGNFHPIIFMDGDSPRDIALGLKRVLNTLYTDEEVIAIGSLIAQTDHGS